MSSYLLLTGATGQLGQYLLRDLLTRDIPTAVLMRGRKGQPPETRLERILTQLEAQLGRPLPRPVCLQGDIVQPRLGLSEEAWRWAAAHCDRIMHNAACVTFQGADRRKEPWVSNVNGTRNVLEFCRQAGLREFHYMSTAYVCGKRRGTIYESDTVAAEQFCNDYENSKYLAEQFVRSATFIDPPTIYRPSMIMGDSHTGYTSSYHGMYHYLRFVAVMQQIANREPDGRWHVAIRYNLTGEEIRNLVPVDWVSAASTHILLNPSCHGRTYHLTPVRAITSLEVDEAVSSFFQYYGQSFAGPNGLVGEHSELEKLFYSQMIQYAPYWSEEPRFDCRNTMTAVSHLPCPNMDKKLFHKMLDFAVRDRWGKSRVGG